MIVQQFHSRTVADTHQHYVEKVVLAKRCQNFIDGVVGDDTTSTFHAPAAVNENHDIFRIRCRLNVPFKKLIDKITESKVT